MDRTHLMSQARTVETVRKESGGWCLRFSYLSTDYHLKEDAVPRAPAKGDRLVFWSDGSVDVRPGPPDVPLRTDART